MTDDQLDISIIIVNYNGGSFVDQCLASLEVCDGMDKAEVIFVDNGSVDKSGYVIKEKYAWAKCEFLDTNIGLAKAFNIGLRRARGRVIMSLDNDTELEKDALTEIIAFFDTHPDAGAVGSRLYNPDMTIQHTARHFPSPINSLFGRRSFLTKVFPNNRFSKRYLLSELESSDHPYVVDWVSTAALAVRREVADTVGGLDEDFFVYWVDADWCQCIHKAGWKIYCLPSSKVIHNENLKQGRRDKRKAKMILDFHKGVFRYYRKHHVKHWYAPNGVIAAIGLGLHAALLILADDSRRFLLSAKRWYRNSAP